MFETLNYSFNWIGLFLQIAGVAIGAYTLTRVKYRQGSFDPKNFDSKNFDTGDDASNLPVDPVTKKPVPPIIYNRITAGISVTLLIIGLTLQMVALDFPK